MEIILCSLRRFTFLKSAFGRSKFMEPLIAILMGLGGLFTTILYSVIGSIYTNRAKLIKKSVSISNGDIASDIAMISDTLNLTSARLDRLERTLRERIAFVKNLEAQAKKAESIATLNEEQVNAINFLLNSNLKKESRSTFWRGIIVNFLFFVLGSVASYLIAAHLV